jgi:hypothetical protein
VLLACGIAALATAVLAAFVLQDDRKEKRKQTGDQALASARPDSVDGAQQ